MKTTIGVHTHVTNPLSSGYLGYLACIESWARVADEVVVVDGGSTDGSIPYLLSWLGVLAAKIKIVCTNESSWGTGQLWFWPQIAINRQVGFEALETDWAIHVDADHVLHDTISREEIVTSLKDANLSYVHSFWVNAVQDGQIKRRIRTRAWVVNKRKVVHDGVKIGYGIEERSGVHLDYPLRAYKYGGFLDPLTGWGKEYCVGDYVEPGSVLEIEVFRYGHFFFSVEQCISKCRRLDLALARYSGNSPSSNLQVVLDNKIPQAPAADSVSKDQMLDWPHPKCIKRVLSEHYRMGMIGGVRSPQSKESNTKQYLVGKWLHVTKRLQTAWLRSKGYSGAILQQQWQPLDTPIRQPLNVRDVYAEQDRYLPSTYCIET